MGTEIGSENPGLVQPEIRALVRREPCAFDVFQLVRLFERLQPGRAPIGGWAPPHSEIVRFSAHASLAFPASQIQALDWAEGRTPRLTVNFMGLIGPLGVLPLYYTQMVEERLRARDHTMRDFLDIFHHRMISLFYRAWEKYRFAIAYERDRQDPFSRRVLDLIGIGTAGLQHRQAVGDEGLMFYAGLLRLVPHSETALRHLLADYFGVEVEIEQFIGTWRRLDQRDVCRWEESPEETMQLGVGCVAGDEMWDQQSRVRVSLGPLERERYYEFLPGGRAYKSLSSWLRFFSGGDLEYEIRLILKREQVPFCELDGENSRLGWLTWMKSRPQFDRDPGDTVFLLEWRN